MRTSLVAVLLLLPLAAPAQVRPARPTGSALTGLPALNFDADEGVGYGALLQYYDYGVEGASPYRYSLQPTVFLTTKGRRDVSLFLDAPHLLPEGWRITASFAREQRLASPYYGVGNSTVVDDAMAIGANKYFYRYGRRALRASADVQKNVRGPSLRLLVGVGASNEVETTVPYDEGITLLSLARGRGEMPPVDIRYARVGIVLDTRDREIGTHRGMWAELLRQDGIETLTDFQAFSRTTLAVRQFTPLGDRLTLAQRVVLQNRAGDVGTIEDLAVVQGSFRDDEALGGASTLRGIPKNRYVGKGIAFTNNELRWNAAQFSALGHPTTLVLSGFVDAGRVWSDRLHVEESFEDLHVSYGGGVRAAIGPTFVVSTDLGHSSQSTAAIYIGLGYLF